MICMQEQSTAPRAGSLGLRMLCRERIFIFDDGFPLKLAELRGKGAGSTKRKFMDKQGWKMSKTLGTHLLDLYVYSVQRESQKVRIRTFACSKSTCGCGGCIESRARDDVACAATWCSQELAAVRVGGTSSRRWCTYAQQCVASAWRSGSERTLAQAATPTS